MIINFNDYLLERKQRGLLYHYTSLLGLYGILNENTIQVGQYKTVSLTRDPNFHQFTRMAVASTIRITLDGDSLSDKYAIRPYNDFSYKWRKDSFAAKHFASQSPDLSNHGQVECEEQTKRPITNVRRYIVAIDVVNENIFDPLEMDISSIPKEFRLVNDESPEHIIKCTHAYLAWVKKTHGFEVGITNPIKIHKHSVYGWTTK